MFTDSWLEQIKNTFKEAVPAQRERTYTSSNHCKLYYSLSTPLDLNMRVRTYSPLLPPALKDLAHSGPSTNINVCHINGLKKHFKVFANRIPGIGTSTG